MEILHPCTSSLHQFLPCILKVRLLSLLNTPGACLGVWLWQVFAPEKRLISRALEEVFNSPRVVGRAVFFWQPSFTATPGGA